MKASDLHDLLVLVGASIVDELDVLVGQLLGLVFQLLLVVLGDLAGLLHGLELIHGVTADVAHGGLGFLALLLDVLGQLLAAFLGRGREHQADNLAVIDGLLRKLPLYDLLLRREDAPSCFTSDEDCREMWDEMMTRGTQAHDDYARWIARLSRIGQDLSDFQRNTQWMLSAYFEGLPSCKRENYIDAYGRFKDGIGKAKLADIDEESDPFYDPPVASFRFDFPAHISFIPYRDEKTGKPKMAERSTFDDLIAFFYLDLTRGIAAGNLPRRCKNCGHWFVAVGGYNTQYCDRPILGQHGKTCRSVGAHETAKRKLKEAAAKEYARTYNRLKGRKQRGAISTDEWNCIVAVAEELRAAFQAGEMAESEYCRKLKAL